MGFVDHLAQKLIRQVDFAKDKAINTRIDAIKSPMIRREIHDFIAFSGEAILSLNLQHALLYARHEIEENKAFGAKVSGYQSQYDAKLQIYFDEMLTNVTESAGTGNFATPIFNILHKTLAMLYTEGSLRADLIQTVQEQNSQSKLSYIDMIAMTINSVKLLKIRVNDYFDKFSERLDISYSPQESSDPKDIVSAKQITLEVRHDILLMIQKAQEHNYDKYKALEKQVYSTKMSLDSHLVERLIGTYLLHGTGTAKMVEWYDYNFTRFRRKWKHRSRGFNFASEVNLTPSVRRTGRAYTRHSIEIKILLAKLKRFADVDFNSENQPDYREVKDRLYYSIQMIKKHHWTVEERLQLFDDYFFNVIDKQANVEIMRYFTVRRTNQFLSFCNRDWRIQLHHYQREKEVAALFEIMLNDPDYHMILHENIMSLLTYYHFHLTRLFLNMFRRANQLSEGKPRINNYVINLINRELADISPTTYYHSPFNGLQEFLSAQKGNGLIQLSPLAGDFFKIDYHGSVLGALQTLNLGEQSKQRLKYGLMMR